MAITKLITPVTVKETGATIFYAAIADITAEGVKALACYRPRHFENAHSAHRSLNNHINALTGHQQLSLV